MTDVSKTHRLALAGRLLGGLIALTVAIGTGAVAAAAFSPDAEVQELPPPVVPDYEGAADAAAILVAGLRAPLPSPEDAPDNPRAPTPELKHGLLEIPSIGLSQPFFEGVTLTAIDRGPSHWPGTAMPGQLGNVVIAGHRTTHSRPMWDLDLVKPGEELIFTMVNGDRFVYELDRLEVVDADQIEIIDQGYGYTATLFGCHPKGSARQRMVGHFSLARVTLATPVAPPAPPVADVSPAAAA